TRRTPAPAVGRRRLVEADPVLLGAVEIRIGWESGPDGRRHQPGAQRPAHCGRYIPRPAHPGRINSAPPPGLPPLENRPNRSPLPAVAASLAPAIVVSRGAAHIDHAVDRTGAAENLAAGLIKGAVVELLFRLTFEHPVDARVGEGLGVAERNVNPWIAVAPAG